MKIVKIINGRIAVFCVFTHEFPLWMDLRKKRKRSPLKFFIPDGFCHLSENELTNRQDE